MYLVVAVVDEEGEVDGEEEAGQRDERGHGVLHGCGDRQDVHCLGWGGVVGVVRG